ncbi:MAG: ABC transporter ATP-binding protein [Deltaproteobacteria bacterium]|nr:ABC transporter ATP-binding protein [Deltaproteobacteria bacterium]
MPLLEVDNLRTEFRTREGVIRAVDGVSLTVEAGETLGIVGESGSGKSVLNLSLLRLIPQPPGHVSGTAARFQGRDLLRLPLAELRRLRGNQIAMIFQDPMTSLNPFLSVARQLTEVLEVHRNATSRQALRQALEMLELVGIPDPARRIHNYPHQFSGGMRQRVMIAMALLCRPALLIADEPTTALDVTIQAQILELLQRLQREFGMAIIFISHNLGVVAGCAQRVAVMYAGQIVELSPTAQLFHRPMHPYTRALLASVPRLDEARHRRLHPIREQPPDLLRLPSGCRFHPRCDLVEAACRIDNPPLVAVGHDHCAACPVTARPTPAASDA